jgi:hypothetical protein
MQMNEDRILSLFSLSWDGEVKELFTSVPFLLDWDTDISFPFHVSQFVSAKKKKRDQWFRYVDAVHTQPTKSPEVHVNT